MWRQAFVLAMSGLVLWGGPLSAQQDPHDLGDPDQVFIELSNFHFGGDCIVKADVYYLTDQQDIYVGVVMLAWNHLQLMYDSTVSSPALDSSRGVIFGLPRDTANLYDHQAFAAYWFQRPVWTAAPDPRHIGSMYFHLEDWQLGDQICLDTTSTHLIRLAFVDTDNNEYTPIWPGETCLELWECNPTGVDQPVREESLPAGFALSQNYPNPFNPMTGIEYALPRASHVELTILNQLGQTVATLVEGVRSAGRYTVYWDGRDDSGGRVASGVYLYRLRAGEFVQTKTMLLLK